MAFENLRPHQDEIVALRRPGAKQKNLRDVVDHLYDTHGLRTTMGTLSRFLQEVERDAPGVALRAPTQDEETRIEAAALLTELIALIDGRSTEQRLAIEQLSSRIEVNIRTVEELEKAIAAQSNQTTDTIPPALLTQIWTRAFLICACLTAMIALGVVYALKS